MSTAQKRIKSAFLKLLGENDYAKITVTQICKEAGISRVTFYIWYEGKDSLMDDFFNDILEDGTRYYESRKSCYTNYGLMECYHNLLDTLFFFYEKYKGFLSKLYKETDLTQSKLYDNYHRLVMDRVRKLTSEYSGEVIEPFETEEVITFVATGLSGMMARDIEEGISLEEIRKKANILLDKVLHSGIFVDGESH